MNLSLPSTPTQHGGPVLDYLESDLPGYPFDIELDRPFVEELLNDFAHLDLLEEIKKYRWFHDNDPPADRARLSLRRWIAATRNW